MKIVAKISCALNVLHLLAIPPAAPSGPPRNVRVSVTTDLVSPSATIMWDSPPVEEQNGVITGYTVTLTNLDLGITNTHSASSAQFGLTNLEPNTLYTVTVRALTSEGGGPSSLITTFNTRTGGEWVFVINCPFPKLI